MSSDTVVVKAFEVGHAIVRLLLDDDELAAVAGTSSTASDDVSDTVVSFNGNVDNGVEMGESQATKSRKIRKKSKSSSSLSSIHSLDIDWLRRFESRSRCLQTYHEVPISEAVMLSLAAAGDGILSQSCCASKKTSPRSPALFGSEAAGVEFSSWRWSGSWQKF